MVSVGQMKRGLSLFVDEEIAAKLPGWKRWAVSAGAAAYISQLDTIMERLNESEAFRVLDLTEGDSVDIDKIYRYLKPAAEKCNAPVELPVIGTITFSASDVDRLYELILRG